MEEKPRKIDISAMSIVKVVLVLLGFWVAYLIRDVLLLLFVVLLITAALEPFVNKLCSWNVPRSLSILLVFIVIFGVFGLAVYLLIPPLVTQISDLANNAPQYLDKFSKYAEAHNTKATQQVLSSVSSYLGKMTEGFVGAAIALFGSIVSVIIVFALTFYLLLEERGIRKTITDLFPIKNRIRVGEVVHDITAKIGMWLRGQLMLMAIIAVIISIALQILGVPFALALGLVAGLLELVPIVGPIISGALAVIIAFGAGAPLWQLVAVVAIYIAVQQLENNILVPKIMQKAIGVPPVVVIIAILVGSTLLGVGGAILAIPVVGILSVVTQEYMEARKSN